MVVTQKYIDAQEKMLTEATSVNTKSFIEGYLPYLKDRVGQDVFLVQIPPVS